MAHKYAENLNSKNYVGKSRKKQLNVDQPPSVETTPGDEPPSSSKPESTSVFKKLKIKKSRSPYRSRPISFTPSSRFERRSSGEEAVVRTPQSPKKSNKNKVKARWRNVMRNGGNKRSSNHNNNSNHSNHSNNSNRSNRSNRTDELIGLLLTASVQKANTTPETSNPQPSLGPDIVISAAHSKSLDGNFPVSETRADTFDFEDQISLDKISLREAASAEQLDLSLDDLFSAIVVPASPDIPSIEESPPNKEGTHMFTQTTEPTNYNENVDKPKSKAESSDTGVQTDLVQKDVESTPAEIVSVKDPKKCVQSFTQTESSEQQISPILNVELSKLDVPSQSLVNKSSAHIQTQEVEIETKESSTETLEPSPAVIETSFAETQTCNEREEDKEITELISESPVVCVSVGLDPVEEILTNGDLKETEPYKKNVSVSVGLDPIQEIIINGDLKETKPYEKNVSVTVGLDPVQEILINGDLKETEPYKKNVSVSVGLDPIQEIIINGELKETKPYEKNVSVTVGLDPVQEILIKGDLKETEPCQKNASSKSSELDLSEKVLINSEGQVSVGLKLVKPEEEESRILLSGLSEKVSKGDDNESKELLIKTDLKETVQVTEITLSGPQQTVDSNYIETENEVSMFVTMA